MMPPKKTASIGKSNYCIVNKKKKKNEEKWIAGGSKYKTSGISVGYLKILLERAEKSLNDCISVFSSSWRFYRQRLQAHGAFHFYNKYFYEMFLYI